MPINLRNTSPLLLLAWIMALFATLASIYFIEIVGNTAAPLCWFERMLIFSVLLTLSVGIVRNDRNVRYYALPAVILGSLSASYQQLVHWGIFSSGSGTCSTSFVCSTKFFEVFGFVTQATLCLVAYIVVGVCLFRLRERSA